MAINNIGKMTNKTMASELMEYLQKHMDRHGDTEILMQYCDEDDNFWIRFYHFKEGEPNYFFILPEE